VGDWPFDEEIGLEPAVYLSQAGKVFATFDARTQDSGNLSFGVESNGRRWFVKTAGDPADPTPFLPHEARVALLLNAQRLAHAVSHPALPAMQGVTQSAWGPTGHAFQAIVTDEDLEDSIASIRRALVEGGRFAFETRNPAARAWERWTPDNAVTVTGPDEVAVRITTEIVAPFNGETVTFSHTFTGDHAALPQVSLSTLRFLDQNALQTLLHNAGFAIEQQFGGCNGAPLGDDSPEIITIARAV
jgi:hypothetical protein